MDNTKEETKPVNEAIKPEKEVVAKSEKQSPVEKNMDITALLQNRRSTLLNALPQANPRKLERILTSFLVEYHNNHDLQQCTKESLYAGVLKISQLGLEMGSSIGQAYLVPFTNKSKQREAQLIVGYRGLIELALRSGDIQYIQARLVYDTDEFKCSYGTSPSIVHIPSFKEGSKLISVYALALFKNNSSQFEVMTFAEIEKIRARSKGGSYYSPWTSDYEEMAKKTVLRRLLKTLPNKIDYEEPDTEVEFEHSTDFSSFRNTNKGNAALASALS